jgi:predicted CoA-substrate-specific enzyme activase
MDGLCAAGIDIGSTTAKLVICDPQGEMVFSRYRRHHAQTVETVRSLLSEACRTLGNRNLDLAFTGSAGMGIAESCGFPFIQEVVASTKLIRRLWPEVRTLIEIGGEDSKIAFFDDRFQPDIRMNGNCAGGTGAFLEQMAVLLNVPLEALDRLAAGSAAIHPIASRCGVFAKTDIQALLASHVSPEDVAVSVFHALALQVISTLARGAEIRTQVLLAGGPLTFFPGLRKALLQLLNLPGERPVADCAHPELLAAHGAALCHAEVPCRLDLETCLRRLDDPAAASRKDAGRRLAPLFTDREGFTAWQARHAAAAVPKAPLAGLDGAACFLGIDSGSTTTKLLLMDDQGRVALTWYGANDGDPVGAVRRGLAAFDQDCRRAGTTPRILRTAVTGYGEDLIRAAFSLDDGVVETMAHFRAARRFIPQVSFILDIGGQDMKAIYIRDGCVADVQINEACSSGCGSFIETFAHSLGCTAEAFARLACEPNEPFDLGTRCTVFMNSKVKQAFREGAAVGEISAGLAYSVIRNSLFKVLKLSDPATLGPHIVAQGGLFRNPAVLRAFELLICREVIRPDIAELMGAYGAALTARKNHLARPDAGTAFAGLAETAGTRIVKTAALRCGGCENRCAVTQLQFSGGGRHYTGNRCERRFGGGDRRPCGENLFRDRLRLLFDRPLEPDAPPILTFGIPRVLNLYENFPFWCSVLTHCGFRVVLSSPSTTGQFEKGIPTVMSDSLCFPGQIVHGHILELIERGVDRIFYPLVVYESREDLQAFNHFNCPVVTGYPDVIRSAIDPEGRCGIPLDSPVVSFKDTALLKKQLRLFLKPFRVPAGRSDAAVEKGLEAQREVRFALQQRAAEVIRSVAGRGRFAVVVSGRPYHADPLINHGLPELLAGLGVDVIPESAIPLASDEGLAGSNVLTQWAYTNRILSVVKAVAHTPHLELLQLTSFGCGIDAISTDEAREVTRRAGKLYTLIKMDEIVNLGAVRIRLRSMLDTIRERARVQEVRHIPPPGDRPPAPDPTDRTILVPWFSPFYSPFLPAIFASIGCRLELLTPQDRSSVEAGLRYVNNDMCYPAVIVIGDIIKALQSGRHDPQRTTVLLTQTYGQCRASNYLPLARKALAAAGFGEVPVLSLSAEGESLPPSLAAERKRLFRRLALGLIFSDALARMTLATAPYEREPGVTMALQKRTIDELGKLAGRGDFRSLLGLLKRAVADFNAIPVCEAPVPVVGVLGEIFVKHNTFSNYGIVEWLMGQGVEVVIPSLLSFFEQRFVNEEFDQRSYLKHSLRDRVMTRLLDIYVQHILGRVEAVMAGFRRHRLRHDLRQLAAETSRTASLANQAGEGWLLPAEMIAMLKDGITDIICLQPFGCLANQVIGKGVERRLKSLYDRLNLLFLDMDPGTSEVNVLNRLHLMLLSARERLAQGSR